MKKSELLDWLQDEYQGWEALLDQIGPARLEQPDVNGDWSMKDIIAHLTGWNRRLVAHMRAARGKPEPPPPWPAHLKSDDEINAWIYSSKRGRSAPQIRDEMHQVHQQILAVIEDLPDDVRIDEVRQGRAYYLVWLGDERLQPGEFFDHFHDDHEPDIRAWLAQVEKQ